jgi:hypothetical protein
MSPMEMLNVGSLRSLRNFVESYLPVSDQRRRGLREWIARRSRVLVSASRRNELW